MKKDTLVIRGPTTVSALSRADDVNVAHAKAIVSGIKALGQCGVRTSITWKSKVSYVIEFSELYPRSKRAKREIAAQKEAA